MCRNLCNIVVIPIIISVFLGGSGAENTATRPISNRRPVYQPRRQCETDLIEYRLTKLEVQVAEKAEILLIELKEAKQKLQALDYQSEESRTTLEDLKNEISRSLETNGLTPVSPSSTNQNSGSYEKIDTSLQKLTMGVQLVIASLKLLNSDIAWLKKNLSVIDNTTSTLLSNFNQLVTQEFLLSALTDLKNHGTYQYVPQQMIAQAFDPQNNAVSENNAQRENVPKNCQEIYNRTFKNSGIYLVHPQSSTKPFTVACDMETRGGGWLNIQNRFEGSQNFYLNWHDYKIGFGNLAGEFWLGLENIYQLTGVEVNELLIELEDESNVKVYAHYAGFSVGSEAEGYSLKVLSGYSGDAGDSLMYHAGSRFSTKDMDQDGWDEGSCAQSHGGAWWYKSCDTSNLNGKYLPSGELPEDYTYQGMYWGEFKGSRYSLSKAKMMIRPRSYESAPISLKATTLPYSA